LVPSEPATPRVIAYTVIGLFAGLFAGFFGVGGGIIVVPLLILALHIDQRQASVTSLVAIIPTSLVAASAFLLSGSVPSDQTAFGLIIAIGSTITAPLGAWALRTWKTVTVRWIFIVILLVAAIQVLYQLPDRDSHLEWSIEIVAGLIASGAVMGFAAGLLGIGGGLLLLPLLVLVFGVSDLTAKALSLIAMFPAAISGTIGSARAGVVNWKAGMSLGIPMALSSTLGVWLATITPVEWANPLLAALLIYAVIQLIIRTIRSMRKG
jgi:uncharacterized membrane protein YfcA